ncbi:MAG: hypothetical protein EOO50_14380 [Flavobacterium sp.]|uniref:S41 family peptidase n=1 Tax=Flavobacterium sp. TaxID=239 RepID=UPI0012165033|nr:S41 family peptidase [Flavobacterium sp.]RZJ65287.1 MAG: hypothetical protein EOO50_14380 [Flavobacterium sp.]
MKNAICLFAMLLSAMTFGQTIKNSDFESGNIEPWTESSPATYGQAKTSGFEISVAPEFAHSGKFGVRLKNLGNGKWSQISQDFEYTTKDFERFVLSGYIKTTNADGYATLYINVRDKQGRVVLSQTFPEPISGTTEWRKIEFDVLLIPGVAKINVGFAMMGTGSANFDDMTFTKVKLGKIETTKLAKEYLSSTIDIIEKDAFYRDSVNFKEVRKIASQIAANAKTTSDTYPAIKFVLEELKDHHSHFNVPSEVAAMQAPTIENAPKPYAEAINPQIVYIYIPAFTSLNETVEKQFIEQAQQLIRQFDSPNLKGWIVDVRGNTGGNCFPMLQGIAPLLGDVNVSCNKDKAGNLVNCTTFKDGLLYFDDGTPYIKPQNPYKLIKSNPPVAVLTDGLTASSGEVVVLAFKTRNATRFFGEPTNGLTTGNSEVKLSDGAVLMLATNAMTDRSGKSYGGKLFPDETIADNPSTQNDETVDAAVKWLESLK